MSILKVESSPFLEHAPKIISGLRKGGVGVWRWKVGTDILEWTDNLPSIHALPQSAFDGTLSSFSGDIHPDDAEKVWQSIERTLKTGEPYVAVYRTAPRQGEDSLWIEARGGVEEVDGVKYLTGICTDVSRRVANEAELERRLQQVKGVEGLSSYALTEENFQKILDRAVETAAAIFDVPLTKILQFADEADRLLLRAGVGWREGLVGTATVGTEMASQAGYTLKAGEPVVVEDLKRETRFSGPDLLHEHGVVSGLSTVIAGQAGRPFGVFGIHAPYRRTFSSFDVDLFVSIANVVAASARHHADVEQRRLLMREMAHRSGNLLQVVSALANQTFTASGDVGAARTAFGNRLAALSRSNQLIARGGWGPTRFLDLVNETLGPFSARVNLEGRDILLPPQLSFDLSLLLHELATNSAKYGAMATKAGTVRVKWQLNTAPNGEQTFTLSWEDEEGGGATAPSGTGFGFKLKKTLVEKKWGGTMNIQREPHYLFKCELPLRPEQEAEDTPAMEGSTD